MQRDLGWEAGRRQALNRQVPKHCGAAAAPCATIPASTLRSLKKPMTPLAPRNYDPLPLHAAASTPTDSSKSSLYTPPSILPPAAAAAAAAPPQQENSSNDALFEALVQEEMRKMEAQFNQHLGEAPSIDVPAQLESTSFPQHLTSSSPPAAPKSPDYPQELQTTPRARSQPLIPHKSNAQRIHEPLVEPPFRSSPHLTASESSASSKRPNGFGSGLHTLYSTPEDLQRKRRQQQEYNRALQQQLHDSALSARRQRRPNISAGHTGLQLSGNQEQRGLSSPPRRRSLNLEHMYEDPTRMARRHSQQEEYSKALTQQIIDKQRRHNHENLDRQVEAATDPVSPLRRSSLTDGTMGSPHREDPASPHRVIPTSLYIPEHDGKASNLEKKAAYAQALQKQIMENERRRKREKEDAARRNMLQEQLMFTQGVDAAVSPETFSPGPEWLGGAGALQVSPSMTEARRRLVHDLYGSNTSPWSPLQASSHAPPRTFVPATDQASISPSFPTSTAEGLSAPQISESLTAARFESPAAEQYATHAFKSGPEAYPPASSAVAAACFRPSFVRHGALAYDPHLHEALKQKQRQAIQQRLALEKQMAEKQQEKAIWEAKRKADEEAEVRRFEEECQLIQEAEEHEKRRKEAAEVEAREQALVEAQRKREALERAAAERQEHEAEEARGPLTEQPSQSSARGMGFDEQAAKPPRGPRPHRHPQYEPSHERSIVPRRQCGGTHMEKSLSADSDFLTFQDEDTQARQSIERVPKSWPSEAAAPAGGDEIDYFLHDWHQRSAYTSRMQAPWTSHVPIAAAHREHVVGDFSLAGESTLIGLNEEERVQAEAEYQRQREAHRREGAGRGRFEGVMGQENGGYDVRRGQEAQEPMSPLTDLLGKNERQVDQQVLAELHQVQLESARQREEEMQARTARATTAASNHRGISPAKTTASDLEQEAAYLEETHGFESEESGLASLDELMQEGDSSLDKTHIELRSPDNPKEWSQEADQERGGLRAPTQAQTAETGGPLDRINMEGMAHTMTGLPMDRKDDLVTQTREVAHMDMLENLGEKAGAGTGQHLLVQAMHTTLNLGDEPRPGKIQHSLLSSPDNEDSETQAVKVHIKGEEEHTRQMTESDDHERRDDNFEDLALIGHSHNSSGGGKRGWQRPTTEEERESIILGIAGKSG